MNYVCLHKNTIVLQLNYIIREYLNFQLIWLSLGVPHPELYISITNKTMLQHQAESHDAPSRTNSFYYGIVI